MPPLRMKDGFPGEIMYVAPRPMLEKARSHPLIRPLTPIDIGWFPSARYHYRERPSGGAKLCAAPGYSGQTATDRPIFRFH